MRKKKFQYSIQAHETTYQGILFRSRLEAKWAAFFDLLRWKWEYEPFDLKNWSPDFLLSFPCTHTECNILADGTVDPNRGGCHTLLVEVKPFFSIDEFDGMPCMDYAYGGNDDDVIPADSSAAFGINPHVTWWEFGHGSGGGEWTLDEWEGANSDLDLLWQQAGVLVRYKKGQSC